MDTDIGIQEFPKLVNDSVTAVRGIIAIITGDGTITLQKDHILVVNLIFAIKIVV